MKRRFLLIIFLYCVMSLTGHSQENFKQFNTWSEIRKKLTIEYQKQHYGIKSHLLKDPQMIVIHYTVIPTLKKTLNYFKSPYLSSGRKEITHGGRVNVGVHFVVARDGTIYNLLPENVAGRHAIGFNYTSFGIENVAVNASKLTTAQIKANALLVKYLVNKYPSINYLIGHHEYAKKNYPHYKLYRALDKNYKFTIKFDPGKIFMQELRSVLKNKYNIKLNK